MRDRFGVVVRILAGGRSGGGVKLEEIAAKRGDVSKSINK